MTETCGTPEYIAPELLLRVPYTDKVRHNDAFLSFSVFFNIMSKNKDLYKLKYL